MNARSVSIGLLVAGAATWSTSGAAAPCKKGEPFCLQKAATAKPAVRKSTASARPGSGIANLDYTVQGRPSKSPQQIDKGRENDSISSQFRGG
jgi:hypothetical protein